MWWWSSRNKDYSKRCYDYRKEQDESFVLLVCIAREIKNAIEVNERVSVQLSFEKFYGQCEAILLKLDGFFNQIYAFTVEEAKKETSRDNTNARRLLDDSAMQELKWTFNNFTCYMHMSKKVKLYESQDDLCGGRTETDEYHEEGEDEVNGEFNDEVKVVGLPYNINDWVGLKESFEKYYNTWNDVMVMVEDHLNETLGYYDALEKMSFIAATVWHGMTSELNVIFGLFKPKELLLIKEKDENELYREEKKVYEEELVFVEKVEEDEDDDEEESSDEDDYNPNWGSVDRRKKDAGKIGGWVRIRGSYGKAEKMMDKQLKDSSQTDIVNQKFMNVIKLLDFLKRDAGSAQFNDDVNNKNAVAVVENLIRIIHIITQKYPNNIVASDMEKKRLWAATGRILLKGGCENTIAVVVGKGMSGYLGQTECLGLKAE